MNSHNILREASVNRELAQVDFENTAWYSYGRKSRQNKRI